MKFIYCLLFICLSTFCNAQEPTISLSKTENGIIKGTVSVKGNPHDILPYAYVQLKGTPLGTNTNMEGKYELKNVPPGTYVLLIQFAGFKTDTISPVVVYPKKTTIINAGLSEKATTLDEFVLRVNNRRESVSALLFEQKRAPIMVEAIGADELSTKGLNNVAEGVSKITGITQQKSKGVVVRGLSERYNYLTVNGLPIITGNPDKKIIPLRQFSTNMVRNIDVFKTFKPDLSGDFAGASFNIITKKPPHKPTTHIQIGVSGNTQTSFQDFKIDAESASEYFGFSGSKRKLPGIYGKNLIKLGYASSSEESKTLFSTGFDVKKEKAPLASSLKIMHGNTFSLKNQKTIGYYIGFGFQNSYHTKPHAAFKSLNTQGGFNTNYPDAQEYDLTTEKSALISVHYANKDRFKLTLNNIFINSTDNFTSERFGYNSESNDQFFARLSRYRKIIINQTQLLGNWNITHDKRHQLKFGTSYGFGQYNEPDRKLLYAEGRGENASLFIANSSEPNRYYADLDIQNINGMAAYTLGLGKAMDYDKDPYKQHLQFGIQVNHLSYDYFNRVVRLQVNPTHFPAQDKTIKDISLNTARPDAFIYRGFNEGWLNYKDGSDASKFSKINQLSAGSYLSYDLSKNNWMIVLGVRGVFFKQILEYRKSTASIYSDFLQVENSDKFKIMPSLNIKYQLNEQTNLRFNGSITSTRPRVRELLPNRYLAGPNELITGNPELKNSTNYNVDLKYEWFPKAGGVFSVTGFGKYIDAPIETVITPVAGGSSIGFANTQKAIIYGAEIAYRTDFEQLLGIPTLRDLKVGINATLMHSETTIDKTKDTQRFLTNTKRKLQGAAPFIINADMSYTTHFSKKWESQFALTYNVFGERIYAVGGSNLDDVYEQPFNRLNFVWKNTFNKFTVGVEIENLLNDTFSLQQTPTGLKNTLPIDVATYQYGIDFSLSVGYTF